MERQRTEANRLGDQGASLGDRVSEISKKKTLRSPPVPRTTRSTGQSRRRSEEEK